jgi:hypothetical protein
MYGQQFCVDKYIDVSRARLVSAFYTAINRTSIDRSLGLPHFILDQVQLAMH